MSPVLLSTQGCLAPTISSTQPSPSLPTPSCLSPPCSAQCKCLPALLANAQQRAQYHLYHSQERPQAEHGPCQGHSRHPLARNSQDAELLQTGKVVLVDPCDVVAIELPVERRGRDQQARAQEVSRHWGSPVRASPAERADRDKQQQQLLHFCAPHQDVRAGSYLQRGPSFLLGTQKSSWPEVCQPASFMDHKAARGRGCPAPPSPCPHVLNASLGTEAPELSNAISSPVTPAATWMDAHRCTLEMQQTPIRVIQNAEWLRERRGIKKANHCPTEKQDPCKHPAASHPTCAWFSVQPSHTFCLENKPYFQFHLPRDTCTGQAAPPGISFMQKPWVSTGTGTPVTREMLPWLAHPTGENKAREQHLGCLQQPVARSAPLLDPHVPLLPACRLHLPVSPHHSLKHAPARIILL